MKHSFIVFLFGVLFSFNSYAQDAQLPANIDTTNLDPSQIPSQEKLKVMGASDEQIKQVQDFQERKFAKQKESTLNHQPELTKENTPKDSTPTATPKLPLPAIETTKEQIFGHSFFTNNTIKFYDKANQLKAPDNYVLGTGDELSIAIWGFSDFNGSFKIDENGAINPKLVGRIYLKGLTFKDAKGLIAGKFKTVYDLNNSQIDVTLSYSKIITVNIVGEVNNPGSYTIPSINTAFNALVTVGGIRPIGSVRKIYLKRGGQTIKTLDVYEYLMNPDSKQDFFLENNDYLLVPPSGKVVKISGPVKRPLGYELIENENLNSLIGYAGGFGAGAYRKNIQIKRMLNNEETFIDLNYDSLTIKKKDFELMDGDSVIVRKIQSGFMNYVNLMGPVKLPGNYEIKSGDRVSDIITRAEGLGNDVFDNRAYVIRLNRADFSRKYIPFDLKEVMKNPNSIQNIKLQNLDTIKVFSKTYFQNNFIFSVIGAVKKPGDYQFGEGLTLKDALYLAGRLKKEASNNRIEISRSVDSYVNSKTFVTTRVLIKTVQIGDDLTIDKASEDFIIEPYDQILVRTDPDFALQQNVFLKGEVLYPGVYSILNKHEKITDLIQRAGGLTKYAFPEGAKLVRKEFGVGAVFLRLDKVISDTNSEYNYILKGGDTLTIPKEDQLISMKGAINYPNIASLKQVSAPFTKGRHARFYIKNYGLGFAKTADKTKIYVIQPGGYTKRTKHFLGMKIYPKVPKGAAIVVPKKPERERDKTKSAPVDWNKVIENATVKFTALLTLYLILTNLIKKP